MDKEDIKYTPMMEQYLTLKKDYADALVFFRLGDFYEMFFEDAITASKELEIALTGRDAGAKERVPMCGVPHHAVLPYVQKLIQKGYKIAIAEQVTEPGNGLVKREVVKMITPGMVIDEGILDGAYYNYIGSIIKDKSLYHIAFGDISTGDLNLIQNQKEENLIKVVLQLGLKEVLISSNEEKLENELRNHVLVSYEEGYFEHQLASEIDFTPAKAVKRLLNYFKQTQKAELLQFSNVNVINEEDYLKMDLNSKNSLELMTSNKQRKNQSLLDVLDHCVTALGSRKLKDMLDRPLYNQSQIEDRLDYIEALRSDHFKRDDLKKALQGVYDLRRITTRIASQNASGKDLAQLRQTLSRIPLIKITLNQFSEQKLTNFSNEINDFSSLYSLLEKAIEDNPPLTLKDGGIIKKGYDERLDELKDLSINGKTWMTNFEQMEREKTGIKNLKIGYNRVFGYYIEISKGNLGLVQDSFGYERRQTLTSSERFITPELKEKEQLILSAGEKELALEFELFVELRDKVATYTKDLQSLSDQIATIDVYQTLATASIENHYVRPSFNQKNDVFIKEGRHPVVELNTKVSFVRNDVLVKQGGILLITGPNMSGKSTYMRMFAQIVILAQMGAFVPASEANLPLFDAIYTRIGAQDDLAGGQSTFMVEMKETNEALKYATKNSLLIFDEIGRGTATYDGMAIAQAIIEYVHEKTKAITLFSTHYHELTRLEETLERLKNVHVTANEENKQIVFLHKVEEGPTDKSYGINVAELAKLPKSIIKRSNDILKHLESDKDKTILLNLFNFDDYEAQDNQQVLTSELELVVNRLKQVNINELTPLEALVILKELQDEIN
ncbi:DNA mismatch repair protein MutS [Paracholeplasma brassicae]|uniref:DNA mismatch repair protein MutS n=1 Tax=Acholeplasma brassicae TaxID=61635 RepID=U4KT41_9MOLU|nr:DNA mismatch repair protein MutS [Paracholeplasma brassicae]CCV66029.1 DNA mismatch repair protein MutS [Paracholeplasma brassicae]